MLPCLMERELQCRPLQGVISWVLSDALRRIAWIRWYMLSHLERPEHRAFEGVAEEQRLVQLYDALVRTLSLIHI